MTFVLLLTATGVVALAASGRMTTAQGCVIVAASVAFIALQAWLHFT